MRDRIPCTEARKKVQEFKDCIAARWEVQNVCFGGKPDPRHQDVFDDFESGLKKALELERRNCAPGHPMADK